MLDPILKVLKHHHQVLGMHDEEVGPEEVGTPPLNKINEMKEMK